jgi:DNA mismatch repair protein MutS
MLRHYLEMKARYPDALLFYRLGDFFELFYEDAKTAARELELTLTARHRGTDHETPMCGVPHHAVESYAGRLLRRGYKVVLCDQVEDASQAKGLVRREITRILTPGTLAEEGLLEGKEFATLAALVFDSPEKGGAAFLEVSTGRFRWVRCSSLDEAQEEVALERPSELLVNRLEELGPLGEWIAREVPCRSALPLVGEQAKEAEEILCRHFGVMSLRGFGVDPGEPLVRAAAAALWYAAENRKSELSHIRGFELAERSRYLQLDSTVLAHLEIFRTQREAQRQGTLLWAVDRTLSSPGARLLQEWLRRPLLDIEEIRNRWDAVGELLEASDLRGAIRQLLGQFPDLERLAGRAAVGQLRPRDAASLRRGLQLAAELKCLLEGADSKLLRRAAQVEVLSELRARLEAELEEDPADDVTQGQILRSGIDPELDEARSLSQEGQKHLLRLEAEERERTGIPTLKLRHHRSLGYSFEVSRSHLHKVPERFLRRQTLTQGERFVTPELLELADRLARAESRRQELESQRFELLGRAVAEQVVPIAELGRVVAMVDVLAGWAELAEERGWCRPRVAERGEGFEIREGRHPVLEQVLGRGFVPNDFILDGERERLVILTGPNMGGKSTYIRQVALLVVLAQSGCFLPARSACLPVVDRVFSRVGASDDLVRGESTFMVEMVETARILRLATPRSLVILDEVGRGTSTFDGLSLAWAIAEHLHDRNGSWTLFATHYHELTELAEVFPRVTNWTVAVREWEGRVVFLHKILPGAADRSYGLHVARLAGIPREVVNRAEQLLERLEGQQHDAFGRPKLLPESVRGESSPVQLSLFVPQEEQVLQVLRELDVNQMTPLAALNLLATLKSRLGVR